MTRWQADRHPVGPPRTPALCDGARLDDARSMLWVSATAIGLRVSATGVGSSCRLRASAVAAGNAR
jgi:hypothetical protein